jgi:hypothetical protein
MAASRIPCAALTRQPDQNQNGQCARGHTELCIKVLAGIVSQEAVAPAARVSDAGILLDRGWGRAPQPTLARMVRTTSELRSATSPRAVTGIEIDLHAMGRGMAGG